jgi:hypothetical protein
MVQEAGIKRLRCNADNVPAIVDLLREGNIRAGKSERHIVECIGTCRPGVRKENSEGANDHQRQILPAQEFHKCPFENLEPASFRASYNGFQDWKISCAEIPGSIRFSEHVIEEA